MKSPFCVSLALASLSSCQGFSAPSRFAPTRALFSSLTSDDVEVNDVNDDIQSFADLGLSAEVLTAVKAQVGWDKPTAVQQLAIPRLLQLAAAQQSTSSSTANDGADAVWCEAPTGSGKTAAYGLPLLQNLQKKQSKGRIAALILCPTRELAAQIGGVLGNIANNVSSKRQKKVMVVHGGTPIEPQIAELADYERFGETLDILVATPGRLVDVLTYYNKDKEGARRGGGDQSAQDAAMERRLLDALDQEKGTDASLSLDQLETLGLADMDGDGRASMINLLADLEYLVLDEADRLLGRAFESELNSVLELLPKSKNVPTWMFSATFPKSIEPRLDQVLTGIGAKAPIRLQCTTSDRLSTEDVNVSSSLQKKLERTSTVSGASNLQKAGPASTIALRAIRLEKNARTQALRSLLQENPEWDRVLVFVATRYSAEHVSKKLRRVGILANELHGKLDQDARVRRLSGFKKGTTRVLVTTDVASRGLDIVGLPVMVNYDLPRSTADFVHRVGRTGRAGKEGIAISFVTASSEAQMDLIETRHLPQPMEREILVGFEPDEERWNVEAEGSRMCVPGTVHSEKGLAHDRMYGGIKSRRKSKKDKLREASARKAAEEEVQKT
jgi:ATP-dependent RNA helicase RhlE